MQRDRVRSRTITSSLRVLAVYLAVILGLQGIAAAHAVGSGPLHHHGDAAAAVVALAFSHHEHAHRWSERHHHDAADASVLREPGAEDGLDAAAFALAAALALLAVGTPRFVPGHRRHVWRPASAWAVSSGFSTLPFKPPRRR